MAKPSLEFVLAAFIPWHFAPMAPWGFNESGQLGDGTTTNSSIPLSIIGKGLLSGKTVVQMAAGLYYSLALCSDGTLAAWGENHDGEVGDGTNETRLLPVAITSNGALRGKTVTQIVAGSQHSMALCSDGTVAIRGDNEYCELGKGTAYDDSYLPIDITHNGVLRDKTVIKLVAGTNHSLALCSDGTGAAWGYGEQGQLADGLSYPDHVVSLPGAITDSGALHGKQITDLVAGSQFTLALAVGPIDAVKPTIAISAPTEGQSMTSANFNILAGKATDDQQVSQVFLRLYRIRNGVKYYWNGSYFDWPSPQTFNAALVSPGSRSSNWSYDFLHDYKNQLDDGAYTLEAYSLDGSRNQSETVTRSFSITESADVTKPTVVISSPKADQSLPLNSITSITGSANDDFSLVQVQLKLSRVRNGIVEYWNGSAFTSTVALLQAIKSSYERDITWSYPVSPELKAALDAGTYEVVAQAEDNSENWSIPVSCQFTLGDFSNPVPIISTPMSDQKMLMSAFKSGTINGIASDDFAVTRVDMKLSRLRGGVVKDWNGTAFTTASARIPATLTGGGSRVNWSITNLFPPQSQLDEGQYIILINATDSSGNVGSVTTRINLYATDSQAPLVTIGTPTLNQKLLISSFVDGVVTGTATDNLGISSIRVRLSRKRGVNQYWNGTVFATSATFLGVPVSPAGGSSLKWNLDGQMPPASALDSGLYQLEAYAVDVAGNKSVTVVRPFTLGTDFTAPSVAITAPAAGQQIGISAFGAGTINGTAGDNLGVTSVKVKLSRKRGTQTQYWNGSTFTTATTTVEATLSTVGGTSVTWNLNTVPTLATGLDAGAYTLYAASYDAAGNTKSSASRSFTVIGSASAAASGRSSASAGGS